MFIRALSHKRGVTLVEVLACLVIVIVLASLAFVNAQNSRRAAQIVATKFNLKQSHLAMSLYRADWDLQSPESMVYLDIGNIGRAIKQRSFYGATNETLSSACGWHPKASTPRFIMHFGSEGREELTLRQRHGEASILFSDSNCNPPELDLKADYVSKLAFAVQLDGSLITKRKQGNPESTKFWYPLL